MAACALRGWSRHDRVTAHSVTVHVHVHTWRHCACVHGHVTYLACGGEDLNGAEHGSELLDVKLEEGEPAGEQGERGDGEAEEGAADGGEGVGEGETKVLEDERALVDNDSIEPSLQLMELELLAAQ